MDPTRIDPKPPILIDELIKRNYRYDITTVINTHDMNTVMSMGEKLFLFTKAKILGSNNEDIMRSENKELNDFVFASRWMERLRNIFDFTDFKTVNPNLHQALKHRCLVCLNHVRIHRLNVYIFIFCKTLWLYLHSL